MPHTLPDLPYEPHALEPYISSNTLSFHHGKHHLAYVTNLNNLTQNNEFQNLSLVEVIKKSAQNDNHIGIFNNAAQIWNHSFYWHCMKPNGGKKPNSDLLKLIERDFGSFEAFRADFKQAAITQFGSGWAWLAEKDGKLSMMKTSNADLPWIHGHKALLTCDVWEHAYYIDFQNRRPDYVDTFLDHLVNWDFVSNNLEEKCDFSAVS